MEKHSIDPTGAKHGTEIRELRAEVERLTKERDELLAGYKRGHQHATHGRCCTCQRCGKSYDDCRCDLDDAAGELTTLRAALAARTEALRDVVDALQELRWATVSPGASAPNLRLDSLHARALKALTKARAVLPTQAAERGEVR